MSRLGLNVLAFVYGPCALLSVLTIGDPATELGEPGKPPVGLAETPFLEPVPGPGSGEGLPAFGVKGQDVGPCELEPW